MINNVPLREGNNESHRFKLAQAVNWLLNLFKGLQDSTNNQALVSDGNGSLAFEEVITTEGGQSIADTLTLEGATSATFTLSDSSSVNQYAEFYYSSDSGGAFNLTSGNNGAYGTINLRQDNGTAVVTRLQFDASGNFKVNNQAGATRLQLNTSGTTSVWDGSALKDVVHTGGGQTITGNITITGSTVKLTGLPTSDPVDAGALWNDSGTLKVSAG